MSIQVMIRGGGDLASGVALRLMRAGIQVLILELPRPLAVRRLVSFADAVYSGHIEVEGTPAALADSLEHSENLLAQGILPVLVDPQGESISAGPPLIVVDARMLKRAPETLFPAAWFSIGLGPGFAAGVNCDAAVETMRGHLLGRVYWQGSPMADTGQPEQVANQAGERVIRAPDSGILHSLVRIGTIVEAGTPLVEVNQTQVKAQFRGVVRGILRDGIEVNEGMKIGDIDPRCDPALCSLVSDKALAVGGGVLEAILSVPRLRENLWRNPSP